jgi:membrane-associated phospholipid phosphatase
VTAPPVPTPSDVLRSWADGALLAAGAVLLVLAALPVDRARVGAAETAVFRVANDATVLPFWVVWPLMQLGNLLVVPAAAVLAAVLHRWRLAAAVLLAGVGTYLSAKVVKDLVVRGRPDGLLADVVVRGAEAHGRGFVSGHAAVAVALVAVAWPWLGTRGRLVCAALALTVCLARVHVGAHLPLDVVGGAGLGLAIAGGVRLLLGRPA